MVSRTLGQARPSLTQVSGMTGMSLTDPRFIQRLNEAQEELMNEGEFAGVVDRFHILFDETTGLLVLPYYLDRLLQVTVDRVPAQIMSPWAEFVEYGVGPQDDTLLADGSNGNLTPRCWFRDCLDRGEVVSRFPVPPTGGPWFLRCYASVSEEVAGENPVINLQGFKDKKVIRSLTDGTAGEWYNGENLEISIDVPYTQTTHSFDSLSAVVKPETNGYVKITATDGTSEIVLSEYAPVETTPSYRSYYLPQLWRPTQGVCNRVVLARARRRFVPVSENDDPLIISNINALKCGMIGLWKRDAGNLDEYAFYKAQAVDILNKESSMYRGKSRTPAISFTRGFPIGSFPNVH